MHAYRKLKNRFVRYHFEIPYIKHLQAHFNIHSDSTIGNLYINFHTLPFGFMFVNQSEMKEGMKEGKNIYI